MEAFWIHSTPSRVIAKWALAVTRTRMALHLLRRPIRGEVLVGNRHVAHRPRRPLAEHRPRFDHRLTPMSQDRHRSDLRRRFWLPPEDSPKDDLHLIEPRQRPQRGGPREPRVDLEDLRAAGVESELEIGWSLRLQPLRPAPDEVIQLRFLLHEGAVGVAVSQFTSHDDRSRILAVEAQRPRRVFGIRGAHALLHDEVRPRVERRAEL